MERLDRLLQELLEGRRLDLVQAMEMSGISKSQASRLCQEIDERVKAFLGRPIEGDWPYLWIDATYLKVRQNGRIVSVAVIVAVGVNSDGRREVRRGCSSKVISGLAFRSKEAAMWQPDRLECGFRRSRPGIPR